MFSKCYDMPRVQDAHLDSPVQFGFWADHGAATVAAVHAWRGGFFIIQNLL